MVFKQLQDIPIETNVRGVDSRVLVDHKDAIIKQLILKRCEKIPPHKVPVEVTFFVLEGEGIISIGDERYDVKPWSVVTCPKNTEMSVEAKYNTFSFLNIKTPRFKPQSSHQ